MFMMSAKELAPAEDQGVIFGIIDASANATLDQTSRDAAAANKAFS
jgi:multidrug efflux pump